MHCPACGAIVSVRSEDYAARVVRCPGCGRSSPLSPSLRTGVESAAGADAPFDALLEHADLRSGRVYFAEHRGDDMMAWRWIGTGALRMIIFAMLPMLFLTGPLLLLSASTWMACVGGMLALCLAYFGAAVALNKTGIFLTADRLLIRTQPLPWFYRGGFPRAAIVGARVVRGGDEGGDHYTVHIDRRGGRPLLLGPSFRDEGDATRIAQTIGRWADASKPADGGRGG